MSDPSVDPNHTPYCAPGYELIGSTCYAACTAPDEVPNDRWNICTTGCSRGGMNRYDDTRCDKATYTKPPPVKPVDQPCPSGQVAVGPECMYACPADGVHSTGLAACSFPPFDPDQQDTITGDFAKFEEGDLVSPDAKYRRTSDPTKARWGGRFYNDRMWGSTGALPYACPPNMVYENGTCVYKSNDYCEGDKCYVNCPAPFGEYSNYQCSRPETVRQSSQPLCPKATHWVKGVCVDDNCPLGTHWEDGKCVPNPTTVWPWLLAGGLSIMVIYGGTIALHQYRGKKK